MSPLNITQPLGIWSIMATMRWCPIFPKWDIYQPLQYVGETASWCSSLESCDWFNSWSPPAPTQLNPVRPEALLFELLYVHPFNSRFVSKYIQWRHIWDHEKSWNIPMMVSYHTTIYFSWKTNDLNRFNPSKKSLSLILNTNETEPYDLI